MDLIIEKDTERSQGPVGKNKDMAKTETEIMIH